MASSKISSSLQSKNAMSYRQDVPGCPQCRQPKPSTRHQYSLFLPIRCGHRNLLSLQRSRNIVPAVLLTGSAVEKAGVATSLDARRRRPDGSDHQPVADRRGSNATNIGSTVSFSGRIRIVRSPFDLEHDFACHTVCNDLSCSTTDSVSLTRNNMIPRRVLAASATAARHASSKLTSDCIVTSMLRTIGVLRLPGEMGRLHLLTINAVRLNLLQPCPRPTCSDSEAGTRGRQLCLCDYGWVSVPVHSRRVLLCRYSG
jgi:hypothetical protein